MPIIKLVEEVTSVMVDISINVASGPRTTQIVQQHLERHAELRPLVLVLKYLLAQSCLNNPFYGGMGSYALFLLATFYLQVPLLSFLAWWRAEIATVG